MQKLHARNASRQNGFTLIELLIVAAVVSLAAISAFQYAKEQVYVSQAKKMGKEWAVYSHGVASYIFENGPTVPAGPTAYNGFNWLQDASCGGPLVAGSGYVSCNFNDNITQKFGGNFQTTVSRNAATGEVTAIVTVGAGALSLGGRKRLDLAGLALSVADADFGRETLNLSQGTIDFFVDYNLDPIAEQVTITIDNTSNGADPWLQTSGGNQMLGTLNMGDAAGGGPQDIVNASNIYWTGVATANEIANNNKTALLNDSGNGAIRLAGNGNSFIEFYRSDADVLFDSRIINDDAGQLTIEASNSLIIDSAVVDVIGANSTVAANDFLDRTKNRSLNQAVTDMYMANHDDIIPKPICNTGLSPTIYVSLAQFAGVDRSGYGGPGSSLDPIALMKASAVDLGVTGWRVQIDGYSQGGGYIIPPDALASAMVAVKCS